MLSFIRTSAIGCAVAALSACGGGGGGVASIPPAPVAPTPPAPPPPPPTTPPPVPSGPIGLQAAGPFKTYSAQLDSSGAVTSTADAVQFAYSASDNKYTISLPGFLPGQLIPTGASGSFNATGWIDIQNTVNEITGGTFTATQPVRVLLAWPASSNLKYTSTATWVDPNGWNQLGVFAYGIPTVPGDVPTTGSATYAGSISGLIDNYLSVWGSVALNFDFSAGTLSGDMKPYYAPIWDEVPLGIYAFRDTVFSRGSTSFSGAFQVNGTPVPSSFQGSFNGPQAAELMAGWTAQVVLPGTTDPRTMAGIWTAKRP